MKPLVRIDLPPTPPTVFVPVTLEDIAGMARDIGNALDDLQLPELAALAESIADQADALLDPIDQDPADDPYQVWDTAGDDDVDYGRLYRLGGI